MTTAQSNATPEFVLTPDELLKLIVLGLYWGDHDHRSSSTSIENILSNFEKLDFIKADEIKMLKSSTDFSKGFKKYLEKYIGYNQKKGRVADRLSFLLFTSGKPEAKKTNNFYLNMLVRQIIISEQGKEKALEYKKRFAQLNLNKELYLSVIQK